MIDTIRAEAEYHARSGGHSIDNPYPHGTEYRDAWDRGFLDGLLYVRNEFKVTQRAFARAVDENGILKAQLAQVKAEYDAFLLEQGY